MLAVIGGNLDLNSSILSDDERAFLYMKMQKSLRLKHAKKKPGVSVRYNDNAYFVKHI